MRLVDLFSVQHDVVSLTEGLDFEVVDTLVQMEKLSRQPGRSSVQ